MLIEDTRFVFPGLRPDGVFLGERDHIGDSLPEFIGARPQDLDDLYSGMLAANNRMRDGNDRVHRCLFIMYWQNANTHHQVLSSRYLLSCLTGSMIAVRRCRHARSP